MPEHGHATLVTLEAGTPPWNSVYVPAPLVLVTTIEPDGSYDVAPKHMAMPLGWGNYYGFVCTPRHRTYRNIEREGCFTVTYVTPSDVLLAAIAATSPNEEDPHPSIDPLPLTPATKVAGAFVSEGYLFLECKLDRIVDGLGDNALIIGDIKAAHAREDALRDEDRDDADLLYGAPPLVFLPPNRFAEVRETRSFPFPMDFKR